MEINDCYFTISKKSESEFKEKGSKFQGLALPFQNADSLKSILDEIKSQHPKARHFCFAYKIGFENSITRSNDDGEPSGSAGKPILNAILSKNLTNILIVVVRYFGGSLLGIPGLINAYKIASLEAITNNNIETKFQNIQIIIHFQFGKTNEIMRIIKEFDLKIVKQAYLEKCLWTIEIRQSLAEKIVEKIANLRNIEIEKSNQSY